jgi:hypothetical protein
MLLKISDSMSLKSFLTSLTSTTTPLSASVPAADGAEARKPEVASIQTPAEAALAAALQFAAPYKTLDAGRQARAISDAFFDTSFTMFDHSTYVTLEVDRMETLYAFWATPTALDPTPDTTPEYLRSPNAPPRRRPLQPRWLAPLPAGPASQSASAPETLAYITRRNAERAALGQSPLFPLPAPAPAPTPATADGASATGATSSATATDSSSAPAPALPTALSTAFGGASSHLSAAVKNAEKLAAHTSDDALTTSTTQTLAATATAVAALATHTAAAVATGQQKQAQRKQRRRRNIESVRTQRRDITAALNGALKRLDAFHQANLAQLQQQLNEPVPLPEVALSLSVGAQGSPVPPAVAAAAAAPATPLK